MCGGVGDNQIEVRGGGYGGHGKANQNKFEGNVCEEMCVCVCVCVKDRESG